MAWILPSLQNRSLHLEKQALLLLRRATAQCNIASPCCNKLILFYYSFTITVHCICEERPRGLRIGGVSWGSDSNASLIELKIAQRRIGDFPPNPSPGARVDVPAALSSDIPIVSARVSRSLVGVLHLSVPISEDV